MSGQNTSTAVMQRRVEASDSLDDYPTPPWATRALCEFLQGQGYELWMQDCREPAANRGHMVTPLSECFEDVWPSDVRDYGPGYPVRDYLYGPDEHWTRTDWTITNPPFRLASPFIKRALCLSRVGVAVLVRSAFLEGQERHNSLFAIHRPAFVLQFVERCLILKGRIIQTGAPDPFNLDADGEPKKGTTATSYCWVIWIHGETDTRLRWLADCRRRLERAGDYPEYAEQWATLATDKGGLDL